MKASDILPGKSAEKRIEIPMPNGQKVEVLLRPIDVLEEAAAIEYGAKFAAERGDPGASHGNPLFDIGLRAYTMYVATLDVDSPPNARERFFASPDQVAKGYHPEWLIYLYHHWEIWQEQCSPLARTHSFEDLADACLEMAKDGDDFGFFCGLSPATRASCATFTARLALNSPELKSYFSSQQEPKDRALQ